MQCSSILRPRFDQGVLVLDRAIRIFVKNVDHIHAVPGHFPNPLLQFIDQLQTSIGVDAVSADNHNVMSLDRPASPRAKEPKIATVVSLGAFSSEMLRTRSSMIAGVAIIASSAVQITCSRFSR